MDGCEPSARPLLDSTLTVSTERIISTEEQLPTQHIASATGELHRAPKHRRKLTDVFRYTTAFFKHFYRSINVLWKRSIRESARLWARSWTAEVCSYVFSIITFAGLVATLLAHQNKPNPEWPQLVTINSIVSLFSLLMRAAVSLVLAEGISQSKWQWYRRSRNLNDMSRFDSASRGPWGSILMLCGLRPKKTYFVAAIGALATVMVSLTGFFAQQLLQFETCLQRNNTAAVTLSKTNVFNASGLAIAPGIWDEYYPLAIATNVGLIQPIQDQTKVLAQGCVSGNCTFPSTDGASIATLSISHECEDVTSHIFKRDITNEYNETESVLTVGEQDDRFHPFWIRIHEPGEVLVTRSEAVVDTGQVERYIAGVTLLFRKNYTSSDYHAVQCRIYPTVNTYGVNITNGLLEENLISRTRIPYTYYLNYNETLEDSALTHNNYRMATTHTLRNGTRELCTGSKDPQPDMIRFAKKVGEKTEEHFYNGTYTTKTYDLGMGWYYPRDCVWSFYTGSTDGIRASFSRLFDDQRLILWRHTLNGSLQLRALYRLQEDNKGYVANGVAGNISYDTIDNTMEEVARAMTNVIRTRGSNGPSWYAQGAMWYTTTCVRVRWKWITFPVIMISLTGMFLLLVLVENRDVESDRLWKSSILAALFCEVETLQDRPAGKGEMIQIANSTSVSLEGKGGGVLRLVAR